VPDFLSSSQIHLALQRAEALQVQRQSLDAPLSHLFPTFAVRPVPLQEGGGRESLVAPDSFALSRSLDCPSITYAPMSPAHSSSSDLAPASSSVLGKCAPGKETESVLKITKRPNLRPKDVSYRRSLDEAAFTSSTVGVLDLPHRIFRPDCRLTMCLARLDLPQVSGNAIS
jgi:hypothetical protein